MGRVYLNPLETGMRFDFSPPLDMGRVSGKYLKVGYGDGEGKTRPHPSSLPCLLFFLRMKLHAQSFFNPIIFRWKPYSLSCMTATSHVISSIVSHFQFE